MLLLAGCSKLKCNLLGLKVQLPMAFLRGLQLSPDCPIGNLSRTFLRKHVARLTILVEV